MEFGILSTEFHSKFPDNAVKSLELIEKEYRLGTAGYLETLVARRQADALRIAIIDAQARRLSDTIALYAAMGGGL
jgi:outer membrane protein TolC